MRREGAFEPVRTYAHGYWTGTDEQELTLNVPTHPWFDSPGTFEVMVKVDDVASNYYQVPVLKGPPSIRKVNPSQFTLSEARDQEHEVWIVADNLGNVLNTSALLDGKPIQCYRLGPGALTAFIPESVFKQPGKFGLQVKSSVGLSAKVDSTLTRRRAGSRCSRQSQQPRRSWKASPWSPARKQRRAPPAARRWPRSGTRGAAARRCSGPRQGPAQSSRRPSMPPRRAGMS
jgi:hypothetical protein